MILPLLLVGAVGGLLSGMFGVGGGFIMVPLLMWLASMDQRRAAATSLLAVVPIAAASAIGYGIQGEIDLSAALIVAGGALVGAPIGSWLLRRLPLGWLLWLFIAGMLVVAVRLVLVAPERGAEVEFSTGVLFGYLLLGLVMGTASGMFGIGGGVIAVPVLMTVFGMGDLLARGTSLVALIPAAILSSSINLRGGMLSMRDAAVVAAPAVPASIAGVWLAFLIPPAVGGVLFAALLLALAAQLAIRDLRKRRAR
ncbi:hypothetical protein FHX53_001769 [Yonghaparkia alkaliphila]|uniref:Probable membrane transporter protein n=1 Tax=Microcella alkalica TaxID=355930 RepID=A0A839E8S0_9MICO|nr:hypothetical protein [Microcella alkalica]